MDAKKIIGQYIRKLREEKNISQEQLAHLSGITYQYLSGLENGRENFSIGVLAAISKALRLDLPELVQAAYTEKTFVPAPQVNPDFFRKSVPLPEPLTTDHIGDALNETQRILHLINASLLSIGALPLVRYLQGNNFSGLVSNLLCNSFATLTPFKHNSHQAYPDLIAPDPVTRRAVGLEIKTTVKVGKGGESHNGHAGWHLIGCFQIDAATGDILFVHVMLAELNGHNGADPDWKYVGSKENAVTGSRRTETYVTNSAGTTKLRDGTVYLDANVIAYKRWRQTRKGAIPPHSIFGKS